MRRLREEQLADELSSEELLPRVLDLACGVVGAQYGAMAVLSETGRLQPTLLVLAGDAVETAAEPRGYAELCAMAQRAHAPGEPAYDDPGDALCIASPIRFGGRLIACLYLADRTSGRFSDQDRALVTWLAQDAGSLLQQAQQAELARARLSWLRIGTQVTRALIDPNGETNALQVVTDALHRLGAADLVMIFTPTADLSWMQVATVCLPDVPGGESRLHGVRYQLDSRSIALKTMRSGVAVRVDDMGALQHEMATRIKAVVDIGPLLVAPLSADAPQGSIVLGRLRGRPYFSDQDQEMAELFANQAAVARQSVQSRVDRARLLVLEDRERAGRHLHDSVIQRLFAVGLTLQSLQPDLVGGTRARLGAAVDEINQVSRDVRHTIFSFEGHESSYAGLLGAVESTIRPLATSLGLDPVVTGTGPESLLVPGMVVSDVLAVVYQVVRDAGRFSSVDLLAVDISVVEDEVVVAVRERGLPLDADDHHPAETELTWRAEELGGGFEIKRLDGGTALTWAVPVGPGKAG